MLEKEILIILICPLNVIYLLMLILLHEDRFIICIDEMHFNAMQY